MASWCGILDWILNEPKRFAMVRRWLAGLAISSALLMIVSAIFLCFPGLDESTLGGEPSTYCLFRGRCMSS